MGTKSWDSFKEIGIGFYEGQTERWDRAFESPSNFLSWITYGATESFYEGLKHRSDKKMDSTYDFFNWLTLGIVEMGDGALFPDDPLSKEHWLNSFWVATLSLGGILYRPKTPGNSSSFGMTPKPGTGIPQGLTRSQFDQLSTTVRNQVGHISDDILVHGSRASYTARTGSDIDIAIRVSPQKFDELLNLVLEIQIVVLLKKEQCYTR